VTVSRLRKLPSPEAQELEPFKVVCRRLGIHPNTGYKLRREDRFPFEVIEVGDRFYCRTGDVDALLRDRARVG
jgi:hypothetical protein